MRKTKIFFFLLLGVVDQIPSGKTSAPLSSFGQRQFRAPKRPLNGSKREYKKPVNDESMGIDLALTGFLYCRFEPLSGGPGQNYLGQK